MDPVLGLEIAAAALAGWAAWLTLPRPPHREWERLFKVALSTQLWTAAQRDGGADAEVEARWLTQRLKGELLLVQGAGHYPHLECAEQVAPRLVAFIDGLASHRVAPRRA